ncbi:MAG: thiamine-phosphate kinase [Planctomycetes bacterium]|nr:thiamine-phosphate kinase [Planctomycetota bacterium]
MTADPSKPGDRFVEEDLLAHIRSTVAGGSHVTIGPGDDMALIQVPGGEVLAATDLLVEGRHFLNSATPAQIGRKAVARNISDVAAMAARPVALLAACVLPRGVTPQWARQLVDAIEAAARHFKSPLIGGDTSVHAGDGPLTIAVTVLAEPLPGVKPILRCGAKAGDDLYVTGSLGGSLDADGGGHHFTFEPRVAEAHALARLLGANLHAMMDLSDGLACDGERFARAGGLQAVIEVERLPCSQACVKKHTQENAWRGALGDGEDYELLFAVAGGTPVPATIGPGNTTVTRVGSMKAMPSKGAPALVCTRRNQAVDVSTLGRWHDA